MKVKMITLGCKVNQYESEAMLSSLLKNGFSAAQDGEPADVVVLNSCTVTAESDRKVRQVFRRAKKDNPDAVMVLSGCMAQAFPEDAKRLEVPRTAPVSCRIFSPFSPRASGSSTSSRIRAAKRLSACRWIAFPAARALL